MYWLIILLSLIVFYFNWNYLNFYNPFNSIFIGYILFVAAGAVLDNLPTLYQIETEVKNYVILSLVFLLAGGLLSSLYLKCSQKCIKNNELQNKPLIYKLDSIVHLNSELKTTAYFFWFIGICITLFIYSRMEVVPLLSDDVHYHRVEQLKGNGYLHKISLFSIYLSLSILTIFRVIDKSSIHFMRLSILILIAFILLQGYAVRADSLKTIAFPLLVIVSFFFSKKIKYIAIIIAIGFIFFGINGLLQYFRHHSVVTEVNFQSLDYYNLFIFSISNVAHRFWVQIENIQHLFDYVEPASLNGTTYMVDLSMLLPNSIFPEYNITAGQFLKEKMGLVFIGGGVTPTFIGEAYVNFGKASGYILIFLVGFFSNLLYPFMKIAVKKMSVLKPLAVAFSLICSFSSYGFMSSSFFGVVIQTILPLCLVTLLFYFTFLLIRLNHEIHFFSPK